MFIVLIYLFSANWDYNEDGECGPNNWPGHIHGKNQSPIDLQLSKMKVVNLEDHFQFNNYHRTIIGEFVNTGKSVQFVPDAGQELPTISGGMLDQEYRFLQYHFHWGQHEGEGKNYIMINIENLIRTKLDKICYFRIAMKLNLHNSEKNF